MSGPFGGLLERSGFELLAEGGCDGRNECKGFHLVSFHFSSFVCLLSSLTKLGADLLVYVTSTGSPTRARICESLSHNFKNHAKRRHSSDFDFSISFESSDSPPTTNSISSPPSPPTRRETISPRRSIWEMLVRATRRKTAQPRGTRTRSSLLSSLGCSLLEGRLGSSMEGSRSRRRCLRGK